METVVKKLGKFQFEKNYIYEEHKHSEYEINYINSGQCIMVIGGKSVALHKGDCVVIVPMISHNFIVSKDQTCSIMQLEVSGNSDKYLLENIQCLKLNNCTDILESLSYLYKYSKNCSEYYNNLFELELSKLFVIIAMHSQKENAFNKNFKHGPLNEVFEYIDSNYSDNINLDNLAKEHHISSRYLRKLFIQNTGLSAIDYITALRLEKAKDLLKNTKYSVSRIALDVGYNSCQYFSSIFKNKIGITPKEFRQQYII